MVSDPHLETVALVLSPKNGLWYGENGGKEMMNWFGRSYSQTISVCTASAWYR
jgi:hypothetical protein